jgi:hypothetical protein
MKWYNTRLDKLPKDKQVVLVSLEGVNYIATYDANRKIFQIESKATGISRSNTLKADLVQLYWTEYVKPGSK